MYYWQWVYSHCSKLAIWNGFREVHMRKLIDQSCEFTNLLQDTWRKRKGLQTAENLS